MGMELKTWVMYKSWGSRDRKKKETAKVVMDGFYTCRLAIYWTWLINQCLCMDQWACGGHEEVEEHCSSCLDGCALNKTQGRVQAD